MLNKYCREPIIEAGCDEAGRGCLAGPVFAASVILPDNFHDSVLTDSKKLTSNQRERLRPIIETQAIAWAVAMVSPEKIDEINILKASFLAMHQAIDQLSTQPEFLIIDGNRFTPYFGIPHQCIIGGDGKYFSIAAASILAKTHRDNYMMQMHLKYPQYSWKENKGYPTKAHREAIRKYGISPLHRKSFRLLKDD